MRDDDGPADRSGESGDRQPDDSGGEDRGTEENPPPESGDDGFEERSAHPRSGDDPRPMDRIAPPEPGADRSPNDEPDATPADRGGDRNGPGREPSGHPPRPSRDGTRTPEREQGGGNWKLYAFDLLSSVAIVVVIGGLLFTASGIWPPMVAVESGSMEPVMEKGDLVYIMESDRFPGRGAHEETGVVTAESARESGYRAFEGYGDVVVFKPGGNDNQTPIIHRAMLWVEAGERWYDRANKSHVGLASSCGELDDCPAPYAGFITKGDANPVYDQVLGSNGRGRIVRPEWVIGTAEIHVPYLGQIRLRSAGAAGLTSAENVTNATTPRNASATGGR